ncbi:MAG: hypothetical protein IKL99_03085 [Oscillospiraceae bacterium]|nr:hypothetical protein [Oscillospiraceae bacterium]
MEEMANVGKRYLAALRGEVKRLMLTAEESLDGVTVEKMTEKLGEEELRELERVFAARVSGKLGLKTQLGASVTQEVRAEEDFRI